MKLRYQLCELCPPLDPITAAFFWRLKAHTLLKVDTVVTSSNAPNASPPKYNDTLYEKGRLVSVWGGENLTVKVQGLEGIDLPADSLVWNVEGFDVPNNSLEYTFWWPSPRTPLIEIDLFGEEISKIHIDVPSAGSITENDALVQLAGTAIKSMMSNPEAVSYLS